jgi:hypothetical protein
VKIMDHLIGFILGALTGLFMRSESMNCLFLGFCIGWMWLLSFCVNLWLLIPCAIISFGSFYLALIEEARERKDNKSYG